MSDHEPYFEDVWRKDAQPGRSDSVLEAGDRRHAAFMQDADIVIHEAQYTPEEYLWKRHRGHSSYTFVVELAAAAGVRRLFLAHHDPSHDDAFMSDVEKRAQKLAKQLNAARRQLRL